MTGWIVKGGSRKLVMKLVDGLNEEGRLFRERIANDRLKINKFWMKD